MSGTAGDNNSRSNSSNPHELLANRGHNWATVFKSLISGGCAGAVAKTSVAPLDRVKILMQVRSKEFATKPKISFIVTNIVRKEGVLKLYKGNSATIARIIPYAAIQFTVFEQLKLLLITADKNRDRRKNNHNSSGSSSSSSSSSNHQFQLSTNPLMLLGCGSIAGACSVLCTYPLDLVRARFASQTESHPAHYRHLGQALATIIRTEGGIRALFQGLKPTLQGIIPYAGVNFMMYDSLKTWYIRRYEEQPSGLVKALCGGLAGAVGQTVSYPWDVVRRRMQLQGFTEYAAHIRTKPTVVGTWVEIVRTEGVRGLTRGISINYLKVVPMVSLSFFTYELVQTLFHPSTTKPPDSY